ncbi:hypothetical protein [Spirosoma pollinicola]|uniref:Uncharacterized protein n=1 Tax=Spirosoma pollinicola TaxID=2057025 RepID=A0A2K8ZAR7_9BACT|nr:hypothetical protein [Spirosoma pollinicola]AUD06909.1 hypothetical protein CWM47_36765 [Spirosoma pollinicola]
MKVTKWSYELNRFKKTLRELQAALALAEQSVARWEQAGELLLVIEFKPQIEQLTLHINELSDLISGTEALHQAAILIGNYTDIDLGDRAE